MTDGLPPKADPESLVLKVAPRRVVRFKRHLLIGIAAVASVAVLGIAMVALRGPSLRAGGGGELYNVDRKPTSDEVSELPGTYADVPQPKVQLGPPLPGDLGPSIVQREQQLGVAPAGGPESEDEAARAERMRVAQQAQQALEAGLFYRVEQRDPEPASKAAAPVSSGEAVGANAGHLTLDLDRDQNDQQRKLDFVNQAAGRSIYNDHTLQTPASPDEVMAGTVIAASLLTGLDSDLPGMVTAQVTENVYDSVTGHILLIPQGSRLIGSYDSVVAFGQSRALLVWQRIVMPDGSSIEIDNLPASDTAGYAGLSDKVDYHTWTLLKGIAMSTLLGVGTQVSFGNSQDNLVEAIRQSSQQSTNQAGQRIVEKDLNIQPTLTVRPGWPLRVVVHKDIVLRAYQG